MRIAILGGTGATGTHMVSQALERGHEAVVLTRDPAASGESVPRREVVRGDALDRAAVERVVAGADAVCSALGPRRGSPPDLLRLATENILAAMTANEVRRLVALTGAGVFATGDRPKPVDRVFTAVLGLLQRRLLQDSVAMVDRITASDRDWVVVRAPRLVDGPRISDFYVGPVGPSSGTRATRATVAAFMLDQLVSDTHLRSLPVVTTG